jgi:hypothetical protein
MIKVLSEMNKYRRSRKPYAKAGSPMPYTTIEFGEAIDYAIRELRRINRDGE